MDHGSHIVQSIPNFTTRLCRGEQDFPAIVAINNLSWPLDDRLDVDTLESRRVEFESIINFDLTQDVLMAEIAGQAVAYAFLQWGSNDSGKQIGQRWFSIEATVVPSARHRGIGRVLQGWLESRAREITRQEAAPAAGQYLTSFTRDKAKWRTALLQQAGFSATDFWYGMQRLLAEPIPSLSLPPGVEVRPAQPEQFRQILAAQLEAFRDMPGIVEPTETEIAEFVFNASDQRNQYELWQVAWDGDQIAGMVLNNIDVRGNTALGLNRGFTDPVCVRHAWRNRGLAKALLARSFNALKQQGVEAAFLGVDTQNSTGALKLYEDMGFIKVKSGTTYQKAF